MKSKDIFDTIRSTVEMVLPAQKEGSVQPSDSLRELGANSLERMEIVTSVMEQLSVNIPRRELLTAKNLGDLAALIETHLSGA